MNEGGPPPEAQPAQAQPEAEPHQGEAVQGQAKPANVLAQGQYREQPDLPDMPGYRLLHTLEGHGGKAVTSVRFDPRGQRLASCGADQKAVIWDVETGQKLHVLEGHTGGISDVAWTPDGRYLATASDDCTLRVWDTATGACMRVLKGHTHYVFCCAFSSGANLLVSGGFDEVVIVWDVRQGRAIKIIPGHSDPVSGVHFSGEQGLNELIASCSFDGLTRVWHTSSGRCHASLIDKDNPALSSVRFTPNGRYLLTATLNSKLLLWDPQSRKVKKTYTGHLNEHSCCHATFVVHDPQRKYVMCGSEDHHVYLWDLQTKTIAGILRGRPSSGAPGDGHCATVLAVDAAAEEGCMHLASGGQAGDGTIKIWKAAVQAAAAAAVDGHAPMDAS